MNTDKINSACDTLARRVVPFHEGCISGAPRIFDACMRMFDRKVLPAQAVTFRVFYGFPVNQYGTATIDIDGNLTCQLD